MALPNFPNTDRNTEGNSFSATTVVDATASDTAMLQTGCFASDAQYSQHGTDPHLTGSDGETVIVRDDFLADPVPDLKTPETDGQYATVTPTVLAATPNASPVGQATNTEGTVFVVRTNSVREKIKAGDPIFRGDVVETADGGAVNILFVDKTTFALGEDARLAIDELVYHPNSIMEPLPSRS